MYKAGYLLSSLLAGSPFAGVQSDPDHRAIQISHHPEPAIRYCILLTPRSGSSWLADILTRTGRLGVPREYFNPAQMPTAAQSMNAANLADYTAMLPRMRAQDGVFGMRVTYPQILTTFRSPHRFHSAFPGLRYFWLIRQDIVSQAISGSRMVQTRLRHLEEPSAQQAERADDRFIYKPRDIRRRIRRLVWAETRTEAFFARHAITPERISYEALLRLSPDAVAARFANPLGIALPETLDAVSTHSRVSTSKSAEFARRFRTEQAHWLQKIDQRRAGLLSALDQPAPVAKG